jgi:hypothetical protein
MRLLQTHQFPAHEIRLVRSPDSEQGFDEFSPAGMCYYVFVRFLKRSNSRCSFTCRGARHHVG